MNREKGNVVFDSPRPISNGVKFYTDIRALYRSVQVFFMSYLLSASLAFAQQNNSIFTNPLDRSISTIPQFISTALKIMVMVALPVITLFFVYSGFLFIKAQGNPTELTTAKKNFVYVVLGALLILGAWVIATMIGGTVSQLVAN